MKSKKNLFLIVDDESLVRSFIKDVLMLYNLKTEEATDGREAVSKWEQGNFRAILMDIEMPEMDGFKATRLIRQKDREEGRNHTPIYAVSAYIADDPVQECNEAGMDGFIAKPVSVEKLIDLILPFT